MKTQTGLSALKDAEQSIWGPGRPKNTASRWRIVRPNPKKVSPPMPRFIKPKKLEDEKKQAVRYLSNFVVYRSALMGLISLLIGYGVVIFLAFKANSFSDLLSYSLAILGIGVLFGLIQGGYQHYLFRFHHEILADKIRRAELRMTGKFKKVGDPLELRHSGRWAVPYLYLAGWAVFFAVIYFMGPKLNYYSAFFLFLAGFHNARFFYLKRLIKK